MSGQSLLLKQVFALSCLLLGSLTTISSLQGQAYYKSTVDIDSNDYAVPTATQPLIKLINQTFYVSLSNGDWLYKGAKGKHRVIDAYIQIPNKLTMSEQNQRAYLQQIICPTTANDYLWRALKHHNTQLSVHIYTANRKQSIGAECKNPLA